MSPMLDNFSLQFDLQSKRKTTTFSVQLLMLRMQEQKQRLSDIQRDPTTWDPAWCSQYIKSLFEGMNTTPFLLLYNSKTLETEIHDGGHRDYVIQEFMKGNFGVKLDNVENNVYWFTDNPSVKKKTKDNNMLLSKKWSQKFLQSEVEVDTFTDLTNAESTELFRRINTSLDLSAGEQINALRSTPINSMVKDLSIKYSDQKCLPTGGDKQSKRKYLQEKIGVLAFNLYSQKSDGLEHTEGGHGFVAKYKELLDKEMSDPSAFPCSKLERNFSIVHKVMGSIEHTHSARSRDMIALSSIENNSPVSNVKFTAAMLTQFYRTTTCPQTQEAPWIGLWNLTHDEHGVQDKHKNNSGSLVAIRKLRTAAKVWYERAYTKQEIRTV